MLRIVALSLICVLAPLSACDTTTTDASPAKAQVEIDGKAYTLKVEADRVKILDDGRQVAKVKDKGGGKL